MLNLSNLKKRQAANLKLIHTEIKKDFVSKEGIVFNAEARFSGYTGKDKIDLELKWLSHVKNKYMDLGDLLVREGRLIKDGKSWIGIFEKDGKIILKKIDPVDYIMANSLSFLKSGYQYYGGTYYTGMTAQKYQQFVENGGTKAPMGTWATKNLNLSARYSGYSLDGTPTKGKGFLLKLVGPKLNVVRHYGNPKTSTSSNYEMGRSVGDIVKDDPRSIHIFHDYIDDMSPLAGITKTVAYPQGTQMKSLQFNNGDFLVDNLNPFYHNGGIMNYLEYCK